MTIQNNYNDFTDKLFAPSGGSAFLKSNSHNKNDHTPVFSSQDINRDYLTLKGIELKTGLKKEDIHTAIIGEMLDNSIDDMETYGVADPYVYVTISKENSLLKIRVRNPVNSSRNHVFSKELLESIYNFGTYHGTKRIYRINRGALGDASKLMLGAYYVLADSIDIDTKSIDKVVYPITHKTSTKGTLKTFHMGLSSSTDRRPIVIKEEKIISKENYTEVQILLPYEIAAGDTIERKIHFFLRDYAITNTHIAFTLDLGWQHYKKPIHYPSTQPMINNGKNFSSVHFYDLSEFRQSIRELHNKKQTIYDVLQKTFREASNLPKNDLTKISVGELQNSPSKIEEIFNKLRKMPAISEEIGLSSIIPFSTIKKTRRNALENRLKHAGITFRLVKYKQKHGYYRSDNGGIVKFPYFFEVFVGHGDIRNNLKVIQSINSKTSNNTLVFGGPYEYETDKIRYIETSIFGILERYKYSYDDKKCKKPNSIIIINLISPRIKYESHGKSRIDKTPFAEVIASTIADACKGGSNKGDKISQIAGLREILVKRKVEYLLLKDPVTRKKATWTQSDVFYTTRKLLINKYGYTDQEISRDYITGSIREECARLGVTREQIGIIAADRAQLYFKGKWNDVGLDEIETLVGYGTDMIIIEKEGVISQIGLFADEKGVALLNTRGFSVEYASELAKLADERGCNISILTDFDVSGLLIFMKLRKIIPNIKRIGVDLETVRDLGLEIKDVEEEYQAPKGHLDPLETELENALEEAMDCEEEVNVREYLTMISQLKYLRTKRIEINSVIAELRDNAAFWKWIAQGLRELFPHRDFSRFVDIPQYVMPMPLRKLNQMIEEKGKTILRDRRRKLQERLSESGVENAFLFDRTNRVLPNYNVRHYDAALAEQFGRIIENDPNIKPKLDDIEKLLPQNNEEEKGGGS